MIGQTISHYQILEKLGEGGMGVVYKAQDTKLNRTVALKFLPSHMSRQTEVGQAASEQDKARFMQEAQAAAALNHSNICTIHGIEESGKDAFIIMEFIDGKTLRQRAEESPLKVKEAINIAVQIAHGLAAAHEKGIVHRDMKSANVMITEKGDIKIMDFGLAKIAKGSALLTKQGTTLGTIAYMSPEQARGDKIDRRTDIWSLGVILYEMLTGRLPFRGEFEQAMIYSLLNEEPEPVTALRSGVPLDLERIISKAMAKDPSSRYQHADELAVDLKAVRATTPSSSRAVSTSVSKAEVPVVLNKAFTLSPVWTAVIFAVTLVLGLVIGWLTVPQHPSLALSVTRFILSFERTTQTDGITSHAISPDGSKLAYLQRSGSNEQLFIREMDKLEARPISSVRGLTSTQLVFSPDGKWLAFSFHGKLSKLSLAGGTPIAICDLPRNSSISWGDGGMIVLQKAWGSHLWIVSSEANSTPRPLTTLKLEDGERGHMLPRTMPGGTHALFTIWTGGAFEDALIAVVDLATGAHRVVIRGGSDARYVPSGHVVYSRGATLMAVPFDLKSMEPVGESLPAMDNVRFAGDAGSSSLSVSSNGTAVYVPGQVTYTPTIVSLYEGGKKVRDIPTGGKNFGDPFFSPDGKKLGVILFGSTYHLGVYELHRDLLTQVTFSGDNWRAAWVGDGSRISYSSNISGSYQIHTITSDGSGSPEKLFDQGGNPFPSSWSPDGKLLAYVVTGKETSDDIWLYTREGEPPLRPLLQGKDEETSPKISPDGRWMAYVSNESGEDAVFIKPFPTGEGKWRVSNGKGTQPRWSSDGKRLYFAREDNIMATSVTTGVGGQAVTIGREEQVMTTTGLTGFDVSPNGRTVAVAQLGVGTIPDKLHIVVNWFEELKTKFNSIRN